jgi:hypothetical protein
MAQTPDLHQYPPTLFLGRFSFLCAEACSTRASGPEGRLYGPDTAFNNRDIIIIKKTDTILRGT